MIHGSHIVARVLAVLLAGAVMGFVDATGNRVVAQEPDAAQWEGADYSSLSRFIEALEEERYTGLIFKRISSELARGRTLAVGELLTRYYDGRKQSGADTPLHAAGLSQSVADDVREAARFAATSSQLTIPDYMIEPMVALAQRTALAAFDMLETAPVETVPVDVPETAAVEEKPEPKARAENTGLYRDAPDMVAQTHLRFLVGGDALDATARMLAEVLKIAREDNFIVDRTSVQTFADRLVEAGSVHPDERHLVITRTEELLGLTEVPPGDLAETSPDAVPQVKTPAVEEAPQVETPVVEETRTDDASADAGTSPADEAYEEEEETEAEAEAKPVVPPPPLEARPRPAPRPAPPEGIQTDAKGDLLLVLEIGMGASLPAHDGDLSRINQGIEFDPGVAARFGVSGLWPNAIGNAHLSFGVVGLLGETKADRLNGVVGPGALGTSGSHVYYGAMPFITIELPVSERLNMRFGGGVGITHQRLEAFNAGVKVLAADGTSLMAQIGGGVRVKLAPCIDAGVDLFATYLDGVKGTGIGGAALTLDGLWDVAATASLRLAISGRGQNRGCGLFGP